jgi:type IV pilus assembly protein PilV
MNRMTGFSLVELLVAVLILAVGLTGLAGLQIAGIRGNQTAYHRSVATQLAYDIADRMRSNAAGVTGKLYVTVTPGSDSTQCETATCTPADLAAYDLKRWNDELAKRLPKGKGFVCLDSTPEIGDSADPPAYCNGQGKVYAVKIWWDDNRSGTTTQGFVTSFQFEGD